MIQSKKLMIIIMWNSSGFLLVNVLPRRHKFNSDYYITEILSPIADWLSTQVRKGERKLIIHSDNACPHTAQRSLQFLKQNRMKKALHPLYSPDLAPSDFYLFGYMKRCLAGFSFENPDGLLHGIQGFLAGVQKVTLQAVFLEWMRRLRQCIDIDGEYID
jgi:histone-lysine N-methyltransferase SETMAR